jgi:hypothetical protein
MTQYNITHFTKLYLNKTLFIIALILTLQTTNLNSVCVANVDMGRNDLINVKHLMVDGDIELGGVVQKFINIGGTLYIDPEVSALNFPNSKKSCQSSNGKWYHLFKGDERISACPSGSILEDIGYMPTPAQARAVFGLVGVADATLACSQNLLIIYERSYRNGFRYSYATSSLWNSHNDNSRDGIILCKYKARSKIVIDGVEYVDPEVSAGNFPGKKECPSSNGKNYYLVNGAEKATACPTGSTLINVADLPDAAKAMSVLGHVGYSPSSIGGACVQYLYARLSDYAGFYKTFPSDTIWYPDIDSTGGGIALCKYD